MNNTINTKRDSILHPTWIATVNEENAVLHNHSIVIHEGRIIDLLPTKDVLNHYSSDVEIKLENQLLIPGLINSHTHSPMSLMRGLSDDLPPYGLVK